MKRIKKLLSIILIAAMAMSFTGCKPPVQDYNVSGYIRSVLDLCYLGETEDYIAFTSSSLEEAEDVRHATVANLAVRFCQKYKMNADDEQMAKIEELMAKALACSQYTVFKKVETDYGYDVKVEYKVQITLQEIEYKIKNIVDTAYNDGTRTNLGAEHIDEIIEVCQHALEYPVYGETKEITFDILVDEDYYLSLNVDLYDIIDEEILVF